MLVGAAEHHQSVPTHCQTQGNGVVMKKPVAMTARFHDREPERKEEGDEKRHWTRLVSFRKSIGHDQSITLPKGTLGRDAVLGRAWSAMGQ